MNVNDYKIVKKINISNKKELMVFAEKHFDKHIFTYRENGSLKRRLLDGVDIKIGRYCKVVEEFKDPFDFPYGFFKQQVFVPQNNGELCIELIFPEINRHDAQKHIVTFSDILCFMEENHSILTDDIPVISPDEDFELNGSLTHEVYLEICQNKDTNEECVIVTMCV